MTISRHLVALGLIASLAAPASSQMTLSGLSTRDSARHALNRLGYGATPGQIDQVAREGVMKWVDRQLQFSDIRDPALRNRESQFDILRMPSSELVAMQNDVQARVQRAQAQNADSATRQRVLDQIRMEQMQNGRKGLQGLLAGLSSVTLVRAVESEKQLPEILADFWTNHFNVFINKGQDRSLFPEYLEKTLRAHALGTFEELLIATAKSPAMLFYLDNVQSVADGTDPRALAAGEMGRGRGRGGLRPMIGGRGRGGLFPGNRPGAMGRGGRQPMPQQLQQRMPRGLNENYARELMELHTLGVDGGYTQQDVINVARILTGWGIERRDGKYVFRAAAHDRGEKVVLGEKFPAGHGEDEGLRLLKLLANNPATMHHVSAKLCARFVADEAPDGCIDDAVRAWRKSGGEIRDVLNAIVHSQDFWAPVNVQNKVKTPLEFVVSAMRTVRATSDETPRLAQQVARLGEPLFQHQTPNGYGETQEDWVNSGALLARMNFAVSLASGRLPGATVDLDAVVPLGGDHAALVSRVNEVVLGGGMTLHTRQTILKELADIADQRQARSLAVGLALGGPEFQRQ